MTHDQLQSQCVKWMWNDLISERRTWHHNMNNSHSRAAGAIAKALGVVAGAWDFEWLSPGGVTVWIDFKVGRDKLSEDQIEYRDKVLERASATNHFYDVGSLGEFMKIILKYY